ncbi:MAG: GEVED domain-containing protein [Bacteroidales bacterium]
MKRKILIIISFIVCYQFQSTYNIAASANLYSNLFRFEKNEVKDINVKFENELIHYISIIPDNVSIKTDYLKKTVNEVNLAIPGTLTYCPAGSPQTDFEYISKVAIGSINQLSSRGVDGYQDFTSQITSLQIGVSTNALIIVENANPGDQILIWIDWNQDGDFDDTAENVYTSNGINFISPYTTADFVPPSGALTGITRMRIRLHDATSIGSNSTACGDADYGEVEDYSVNVTSFICTPPTLKATAFLTSSITSASMTTAWTRGNGNSVLVIARQGSAVNSNPVNGSDYTANSAFGSGMQIGTGNYVIYNGAGTSVNVTALISGTNYYFSVYEYNSISKCYLTPALNGNATTLGILPSSYCNASGNMDYNTSITSVNFNAINNVTAKPAAYNNYTSISTTVNKNSNYNLNVKLNTDGNYTMHAYAWIDWNHDYDFLDAGESYDLGIVVNSINGISSLSPLSITIPATAISGTTRMRISAKYNSAPFSCETGFDGEVEDYSLNVTSITCTPPTLKPSVFTSSTVTNNSLSVGWIRGNGNNVLVLARQGSPVNADPLNGTNYTANTIFGSGTQIGIANYVVYNGTSTSVNLTNLLSGTTYYFAIYEYTGNCYFLSSLTGNVTTTGVAPCSYCVSSGNINYQTSITLVNFNTINNSSAKLSGYSDFTSISTTVNKNASYNLNLNVNTAGGYTVAAYAWIDWNHDCDFMDAGEAYDLGSATDVLNGITSLSPLSITIPSTALTGTTRMRVAVKFNTSPILCENSFDGEVEDYTINIVNAQCTPPVIQATAFQSSLINTNLMTLGWIRGSGNSVIVLARKGSPVNADPVNGSFYTANASFGSGNQIGTGNYVIYKGVGTTVNITSLLAGTNYYFAVYEYNTTTECYLTPALNGNATTTGTSTYCAAGSPGTDFEYISNVTIGTINQTSGRGTAGYQDFTSQSTTLQIGINTSAIVNVENSNTGDQLLIWVDWNKDGDFDDVGENVYASNDTSFVSPHTTLGFAPPSNATIGSTRMRIRLHDTSFGSNATSCGDADNGEVEDYTLNVISAPCIPPTIQATSFITSALNTNAMTVGWSRGNGNAVLVVCREMNAVESFPVNGIIYTANTSFASGSQIGTANYVVYRGNGTSVNITDLLPEKTYYFTVYEFNTTTYCYKTPGLSGFGITSALNSNFNAAVSNLWENTANWDHGIPASNTNAVILANKLAVVNSNNLQCNNLTISPLGKLTINSSKDLIVNGILTLQSDSSGTASLLNKGTLSSVSNIVQKYIAINTSDEFHQLSSPVADQSIASGFSPVIESFYAWNENNSNWIPFEDAGFFSLNGSNNFALGRGYAVSYATSSTKSFTGNLNNTAISSYLTVTPGIYSGWNLIGNPYPSAINWNTSSAFSRNMLENSGLNEYAYWVWNPLTGNYGCFISNGISGTNGVSNFIASMQAFWVKAITAGNFNVNTTACEHSSQFWLKSSTIDNNALQLKVTSDQNNYSDELKISFGFTDDLGGAEKMFSLYPTAPGIYSLKSGKKWSINNLTSIANNQIIPFGFKAGVDGEYKISAEGVQVLGNIILEDLYTVSFHNLSSDNIYSFNALANDNPNRFLLHFNPTNVIEIPEKTPYIYYGNQILSISNPWLGKTNLQIFDINGELIKSIEIHEGMFNYNLKVANGTYIVKMYNEKQVFVVKQVIL